MKTRNDFRLEFNKETQLPVLVTDGTGFIHYSDDYVHWLEDLAMKEANKSNNVTSKPHCWGKMTWILEYEPGKEPPHYICSCQHGNRECLKLTREAALNKQNEKEKNEIQPQV